MQRDQASEGGLGFKVVDSLAASEIGGEAAR